MPWGLYGYDDDGRPMWEDCPNCGYSPGARDDGLCPTCAAEAEREVTAEVIEGSEGS